VSAIIDTGEVKYGVSFDNAEAAKAQADSDKPIATVKKEDNAYF
jgi:hypothetical protein